MASFTQRQALNALVFLYREVLDMPIEGEMMPIRSKKKVHSPTVLTQEEVRSMFLIMKGTHLLMAKLLYGAGVTLDGMYSIKDSRCRFWSKQNLCQRRQRRKRQAERASAKYSR